MPDWLVISNKCSDAPLVDGNSILFCNRPLFRSDAQYHWFALQSITVYNNIDNNKKTTKYKSKKIQSGNVNNEK